MLDNISIATPWMKCQFLIVDRRHLDCIIMLVEIEDVGQQTK